LSAPAPTVVIADDHQITRLGVRMALLGDGFDVVGEAEDGQGAVEVVLARAPDVCLLDISMPGGGLEAAATISERAPSTAVVMLTVSDSTEDVLAALRAGAVGYLPKDTRPDRLAAALCGVLKGEAALPRALVGRVLSEFRGLSAPNDPLRVGGVELTGDPQAAAGGQDDTRDRRAAVALADHRPAPHLDGRRKARSRRPRRCPARDRAALGRLEEAFAHGPDGRLDPCPDVELPEDVRDVLLDRVAADRELAADVRIAGAGHDQTQNLALALAERIGRPLPGGLGRL